jgi:phosphoglycolate phosphatase
MNSKLVLFDIDGTLVYHVGPGKWESQYAHGFKVAYGMDPTWEMGKYNGGVEKQVAEDILRDHGVANDEFKKHYPKYLEAMHEYLLEVSKNGPLYHIIEPARELVVKLYGRKDIVLGILTGNAERIAHWKLDHVELSKYFSFGLYGDVADSRIALAKTAIREAQAKLHMTFAPQDIVVIGDTVHDIRCGKAIGAVTIAVTTGMHVLRDTLQAEKPDLLVESLMDPKVLSLFSLN